MKDTCARFPTIPEMAHNLKPHRLQRLNRWSGPGEHHYSIPDPIPAIDQVSDEHGLVQRHKPHPGAVFPFQDTIPSSEGLTSASAP